MQPKLTRCFIDSAAALLSAVAVALMLSNLASATLVPPRDPVLMISTRTLFWILGAIGLAVALICIFTRQTQLKLTLILWFALNLVVYEVGLQWAGAHGARGYLGTLADTFDFSTGTVDTVLKTSFLYLLVGSSALLVWSWLQKFTVETEEAFFKTACIHCGGKIKFPTQNLGQKIPCPHCQTNIILRKPDFLKMSCFFCKEHIEFPVHAVGQKMRCPHCKMDITLKEPA
jgi:DNA-directed RNA polymerase subunit RPC12/RpoP